MFIIFRQGALSEYAWQWLMRCIATGSIMLVWWGNDAVCWKEREEVYRSAWYGRGVGGEGPYIERTKGSSIDPRRGVKPTQYGSGAQYNGGQQEINDMVMAGGGGWAGEEWVLGGRVKNGCLFSWRWMSLFHGLRFSLVSTFYLKCSIYLVSLIHLYKH